MAVQALNCPMCGAPAASDATACAHCGSRLATVSCPSCFGMMFLGQKFCPHCGGKADRQEAASAKPRSCPRCRSEMTGVAIGGNPLSECPKCAGLWADSESLRQICADREKQAAVLGIPTTDGNGGAVALEQIRYLPCPDCGKLMNRVNFSGYSGVIVDVCREHGTWFDRDELRRVVEFIRAGGLDKARAREVANLEEGRRLAHLDLPVPAGTVDLRGHALWSLSDFLLSFLK